jgi:hypothetical protein
MPDAQYDDINFMIYKSNQSGYGYNAFAPMESLVKKEKDSRKGNFKEVTAVPLTLGALSATRVKGKGKTDTGAPYWVYTYFIQLTAEKIVSAEATVYAADPSVFEATAEAVFATMLTK